MEAIRSFISLKTEKKNSFRLGQCESHAAYLMLTVHFRSAAVPKAKIQCDGKKQKNVEITGGGQQTIVYSG